MTEILDMMVEDCPDCGDLPGLIMSLEGVMFTSAIACKVCNTPTFTITGTHADETAREALRKWNAWVTQSGR